MRQYKLTVVSVLGYAVLGTSAVLLLNATAAGLWALDAKTCYYVDDLILKTKSATLDVYKSCFDPAYCHTLYDCQIPPGQTVRWKTFDVQVYGSGCDVEDPPQGCVTCPSGTFLFCCTIRRYLSTDVNCDNPFGETTEVIDPAGSNCWPPP
jgi:hypothetical protein